VSGAKHLITGADGAAFSIVMAANDDGSGASMFLVDADNPGWTVHEHARTIDSTMVGGHCHVRIDDAFVPDEAVLGAPGEGFRYAQVRLGPARLTHCMRWLGAARRAHAIALARSTSRRLFGSTLAGLGMAQQLIADNEIELAAARSLLWHASWDIATGTQTNESSSRAKVFVSEAVGRIIDQAV
jgi:alkylation response protein AidB-like acyl-CoA dehydrogenase